MGGGGGGRKGKVEKIENTEKDVMSNMQNIWLFSTVRKYLDWKGKTANCTNFLQYM